MTGDSPRIPRRLEKRRKVAYHEAGHAVLHVVLRHPFDYVTIEPCGIDLGRVQPKEFQPDYDARSTRWLEEDILIDLAGGAAEYKLTHRRNRVGWLCDHNHARGTAENYLFFDRQVVDAYLKYMDVLAKSCIEGNWKQIEAIASALLEMKSLTYKQSRKICSELVD